ncbi:MAG: glycosyltransferase [Roseburia sp.]|nr:glycosyltransferase [Anaeroplasma bactoclasticum]MCM1196265.1 glycosyltransferase [Roseburia sp.]
MQKILHIPNYYKPHIGGIEQTCHDIVESLTEKVQQKVICFSEDKTTKHEVINGIEVTKCGVWKKFLSQSISFSYKKELKRILKEFKPDCIIVHFPNPFVQRYVLKFLKKSNIKLIVWYHTDIVKQKIIRQFFKGQTRRLLNKAEHIICTSPIYSQMSQTLKNYQNKISIIPSCINEKRLEIDEKTKEKANQIRKDNLDKVIVFAIGRHVKYKGLTYLIEASKYLDDRYAIYIAGQGPLTEELKAQANEDSKITFLGKLDDTTLKAYYLVMDIYAFPSITKNEAFGLSLAEGMDFKHPAVTFTISGSGVNYVSLNEVTGIEVENSNAKAFAEAIHLLGQNEELRDKYGLAARKRVEDNFTFEKFKRNIISFFEEK